MWIARDKSGCLHLFSEMPKRHSSCGLEYWKVDTPYSTISLDDKLYPKLTWEDEPVDADISSSGYSRLVESKRKFDWDKISDYCDNQCSCHNECFRESDCTCDFVKRMFEIK